MRLVATQILIFATSLVLFAQQAPILTIGLDSEKYVEEGFLFYQDSNNNLSQAEVVNKEFHLVGPEGAPVEGNVYWLHFQIQNEIDRDESLVLDFDQWTNVRFYYRTSLAESFQVKETGHLIPFRLRDYPVRNQNYLRLDFTKDQIIDCYVRLETGYNYLVRPTKIKFRMMSLAFQLTREMQIQRLIFLFLGIYLVMLFYNLFVYLSTRDRSYRYYLILLAIMSFIVMHNFGLTLEIFSNFDSYAYWHVKIELIISAFLGICLFLFASSFLDLKSRIPTGQKVLNVLMIIVFLMPLPSFWGYGLFNQIFSSILGIVSMLTIVVLGIISYRRGTPSAGYFLMAYGVFLGFLILFLAGSESGLFRSDFGPFIVQIGSVGEIILFSFALGNKINLLRQDNNRKQLEIIKQLEENQLLQTKVNRELEQKVSERTAEIAAEKEKSDALLLNILPSATAEELKKNGFAKTRYYENVTVLFTDFKGFTKLTEQLTPQELVEELDHCFKAFDDIVERHGLEKIKTIGDSFMCAGGIPEPNQTNAENAVRAALEMLAFIRNWQQERRQLSKPIWEIRIGIHTGDLVAGVVGKKKFAYDIWGDTVNLASRMESEGHPGKINVSQSTYDLLQNKFKFLDRGEITAKGKGKLKMYFIEEFIEN